MILTMFWISSFFMICACAASRTFRGLPCLVCFWDDGVLGLEKCG
jgi:hypothetical protein